MMKGKFVSSKGAVLVFALWVLTFLTVIAVSVASGVRQKILLMQRLDERQRTLALQQAGVRSACALIRQVYGKANGQYTVDLKQQLHNDTQFLNDIRLDADSVADVVYSREIDDQKRFGVEDEESKVNINRTSITVLQALIERVLKVKLDKAHQLAAAILDWRQAGTSELTGFFSDEYYRNLHFPYPKKDTAYESLDELLLVKGVTKEIFDQLRPFVTIWGDGQININTAPRQVLEAYGLSGELIEKILEVRRGKDGVDATLDDHVFVRSFDVTIEIQMVVGLTPQEVKEVDFLNAQGLLTTNSYYFTIVTEGFLANGHKVPSVKAVYGFKEDKIFWWKEK